MSELTNAIVGNAMSFVGEKEISGNLGFEDEKFEEMMKAVGWEKTQAWCAYFAELVWKLSYAPRSEEVVKKLDKLFSASAVQTYKNFKDAEWTVSKEPKRGSVIIWQKYNDDEPHWSGHVGIVAAVDDSVRVTTIEGNTNAQGGREGIEVAIKERQLKDKGVGSRLVYIGCIVPMEVEDIIT